MKLNDYLLYFSGSLIFCFLAVSVPAQAQIASDNSMSVPTQVIRQSDKLFEIIGGTEAGINLFHSFAEFSVEDEKTIRFINNNPAILNVINRVTGTSASEIFGKIEAGGSAPNFNLFLLNPNGIIFGPNASLDLKGSFVSTTANAIEFGERSFFSASSPNDPSLLTVKPSAFFFNQVRPNSIHYQSNNQPVAGLKVPNSNSLLLLGGDVTIDGGMLTTPNGRIELGGLAGTGTVALNTDGNNLSLSFPDGVVPADVLITNGAKVDVTDIGSGSIIINARNIEIAGVSKLTSGILENLVSSDDKSGEITLKATDQVLIHNNSEIGSQVNQGAIGNSGDISLEAESLQLVNGAFIFTLANGQGNSGNIIINIRDDITLKGRSSDSNAFPSQIANLVRSDGEGNGGNIIINANSLSLADAALVETSMRGKGDAGNILIRVDDFVSLENTTDQTTQIRTVVEAGATGNGGTIDLQGRYLSLTGGSQLAASVFRTFRGRPGGRGEGGDIIVNASDSVNISGVGLDGFSSGIFASTEREAVGSAGNITVNTNFFRISDGGVITAETENSGSGGNIRIIANTFEAINGGQLITIAESSGNAGSITISAGDRVTLSGSNPTFVSEVGAGSGLFARSDSSSAGDVTINTPQLTVQEGAEVTVSSPQGLAGELTINTNSLFLNQGTITAETGKTGGEEGAKITLQILDLFKIENESRISATANGSANGGNIDIDTPLLLVFPPTSSDGSDIIAKAQEGNGGNITINAQGIFGIAEGIATQDNQSNDIDASSDFGASGQVEINNTIDPNRGLVELPETVVDPNTLIAQNPCKRGSESEFVISGRGGLPPSLNEDLSSEATQVGLVEPAPIESKGANEQESSKAEDKTSSSSLVPTTIIPAQGWVFNDRGEVVLVAYNPTVTGSQRLRSHKKSCSSP